MFSPPVPGDGFGCPPRHLRGSSRAPSQGVATPSGHRDRFSGVTNDHTARFRGQIQRAARFCRSDLENSERTESESGLPRATLGIRVLPCAPNRPLQWRARTRLGVSKRTRCVRAWVLLSCETRLAVPPAVSCRACGAFPKNRSALQYLTTDLAVTLIICTALRELQVRG